MSRPGRSGRWPNTPPGPIAAPRHTDSQLSSTGGRLWPSRSDRTASSAAEAPSGASSSGARSAPATSRRKSASPRPSASSSITRPSGSRHYSSQTTPRVPARSRAPVRGSHAGSHTDERPSGSPDSYEQRPRTRPRSRTNLNESGCPHRELRIRRSRARCVPDEADSHGYWQSLADTSACPLTCVRTGPSVVAHVLLSSRSRVRVAVGAQMIQVDIDIRN